MKRKFILYLERGRIIVIKNLKELWTQQTLMFYGYWGLYYKDDKYKKHIIYFSHNRSELEEISQEIMEAYERGEKSIHI